MKKTRKNLLTKFRDFWRSLTPLERKRMWNIMSAIRGEDGGLNIVKEATTSRIRGELFGVKLTSEVRRVIGVIIHLHPIMFEPPDIKQKFYDSNGHFNSHVELAIHSLKPYVKKGKMDDLLRLLE